MDLAEARGKGHKKGSAAAVTTPGRLAQDVRLHGAVIPGVSVKTDSIETAQMLIDAGFPS
ncbi:MAG: hypothetical protein K0R61_4415 [Microvirga sp.]|nr:hypothetical protein [Microvirga sp.]